MNISPFDFQLQFTFANDAMAELDRKLALLYSTREAPCRWIGNLGSIWILWTCRRR